MGGIGKPVRREGAGRTSLPKRRKRTPVVQNGKMGKSHDFPLTDRRKSGTINRTIKRLPQLTDNVVHHRGTDVYILFSPTVWAPRTLYGVRAPFFHFCAARAWKTRPTRTA